MIASATPGGSPQTTQVDRSVTPVMGFPVVAARQPILVVEDDRDQAAALTLLLDLNGYEASSASSGRAALVAARASLPRLMILDVTLPDIDGFAVAEELRKDRRTAGIPIVFLSGTEDLAGRVRRENRVEVDFVRKPYWSEEILARVERCLAETDLHRGLHHDARFDDLTGLGNRRLLEERITVEAARVARYGTSLALVMLDLDRLKAINDGHGHLTGSAVLCAVGEAILAEIRETDLAVRYGGDEFMVLLPHTGLAEAGVFAGRLQHRIREMRPCGLAISASIGLAVYQTLDRSGLDVMARADEAVYRAKGLGGNRIEATA
jgi:diguanylate cyclase (GGDEF)-like protein